MSCLLDLLQSMSLFAAKTLGVVNQMGNEPNENEVQKAIMEYYVNQYLKRHSEEIKSEVRKSNYFTDPEYFEGQIDQEFLRIKEELVVKFNDVCMLIMKLAYSGRESELRKFEVLFLDLLERTLLKDQSQATRGYLSDIIEEIKKALEGDKDIG